MEQCRLPVRLKPNAKREGITVSAGDATLQVAVAAPPIENRANDRCIALLARRLEVPKSALRIVRGGHSRDKVIACDGIAEKEARRRLGEVDDE